MSTYTQLIHYWQCDRCHKQVTGGRVMPLDWRTGPWRADLGRYDDLCLECHQARLSVGYQHKRTA